MTIEELHKILFADANPVYYDIGARKRIEIPWLRLAKQGLANAYGFEPDPIEHQRLSQSTVVTYLPHALGNYCGTSKFYITKNRGCCSCKKPNFDLLDRYPYTKGNFNIVRQSEVDIVTLNSLIVKNLLPAPDFIKIDVQGLEYEVIEGCDQYLDNIKGIKLETHFQPMYEGEKTFAEIYDYLTKKGFILRQLNNIAYYDGDQLEWDAFFTRPIGPDISYLYNMFFSKIYGLDPPKLAALCRQHQHTNIPDKQFYNQYPW